VVAAAGAFALAGLNMVGLESQAGNTVAEAFYNAMGIFSFGMAGLVLAAGIAVDRLIRLTTPPTPSRSTPPELAGWGTGTPPTQG
jgi:hypothetical protein